MKQSKLYVTPQIEVIKIEPQGILCASAGPLPASTSFTGTGMTFTEDGGNWN